MPTPEQIATAMNSIMSDPTISSMPASTPDEKAAKKAAIMAKYQEWEATQVMADANPVPPQFMKRHNPADGTMAAPPADNKNKVADLTAPPPSGSIVSTPGVAGEPVWASQQAASLPAAKTFEEMKAMVADSVVTALKPVADAMSEISKAMQAMQKPVAQPVAQRPAQSVVDNQQLLAQLIDNAIARQMPTHSTLTVPQAQATPVTDSAQSVKSEKELFLENLYNQTRENQQREAAKKAINDRLNSLRSNEFLEITKLDGTTDKIEVSSLPVSLLDELQNEASSTKDADTAEFAFKASVAAVSRSLAKKDIDTMGLVDSRLRQNQKGTTITPIADGDRKAISAIFDKIDQRMQDSSRTIFGNMSKKRYHTAEHRRTYSNAKANQELIKVTDEYFDKQITNEEVRGLIQANRGRISDAVITLGPANIASAAAFSQFATKQVFQRLIALGFCQSLGPDSPRWESWNNRMQSNLRQRIGRVLCLGSETFESNTNNNQHYYDGIAVNESRTEHVLQNFCAKMRALGAGIETDLVEALKGGALPIDALARIIENVAAELARGIDTSIFRELHTVGSRYRGVSVSNETVLPADIVYDPLGDIAITIDDEPLIYGSNVIALVKPVGQMNNPIVAGPPPSIAGRLSPLVPMSDTCGFTEIGLLTEVTRNPISVSVNGTPLTAMGVLLQNGGIAKLNDTDPDPQFAYDAANGLILLTLASGFTGAQTVVISYTYETNYFDFDLRVPSGVVPNEYYSQLLDTIKRVRGQLANDEFIAPTIALAKSNVLHSVISTASLFYRDKSPVGTIIDAPYAAKDFFGTHGDVSLLETNGNTFDPASIYLFPLGMVGYYLDTPVSFRHSNAVGVNSTNSTNYQILTDKMTLFLRDVVGTPVVLEQDSFTIKQLGASRIRLRGYETVLGKRGNS